MNKKRLLIFAGFTGTFLIAFSVVYYQTKASFALIALMLTPAMAVVLTRLITKEGFKELYLAPKFKGHVKQYAAAYLLTPFAAYFGAVVFFLLFPKRLDMLGSTFAAEQRIVDMAAYIKSLFQLIPLAIIVNPVMGILQCLGEEFAWRGYLLPKLCQKFSLRKAALLTGLIWGLWHTPIILMGYNYGTEYPFAGVAAMVALCMVLGIISAFLFFKTHSILPSVIFHAAINGMDIWAPSTLFMSSKASPFVGPNLQGIIGGCGFIIIAVICFVKMGKMSAAADELGLRTLCEEA